MATGFFNVPPPKNEPVKSYLPNSPERKTLKKTIEEMRNQKVEIPMVIGGDPIETNDKVALKPPHDHQHVLGYFHNI